jgi:hypothetical protein
LVAAKGCTVTGLAAAAGGGVEFTRLDEGLPFNFGTFYALHYRFVPVPDELNRYLLTVTGLSPGRYEVTADGRSAGTFTAAQLAAGANIASSTPDAWDPGGPWAAQGDLLKRLTDARDEVALARAHCRYFLPDHAVTKELGPDADRCDEQLVRAQRDLARPRPYHFVIKPAPPEKKSASK